MRNVSSALLATGLSVVAPSAFAIITNDSDETIYVIHENGTGYTELPPHQTYFGTHDGFVPASVMQNSPQYGQQWYKTPGISYLVEPAIYLGNGAVTGGFPFGLGDWYYNSGEYAHGGVTALYHDFGC